MTKTLSFERWMEENAGELEDAYVEMCKDNYQNYLKDKEKEQ